MKKLFYLSIALSSFIFTNSHAQVGKGKFILGGLINPGFASYKMNSPGAINSETWRISSQVRLGYFLTERFNLGIDLGNEYSVYKRDDGRTKHFSLTAGPFMRYYFLNEKLGVFGEGGAGLGTGSSKYTFGGRSEDKWTTNSTYAKFGPGINYFLNENIALEFLLTFQTHWSKDHSSSVYAIDQKMKSHVLDFKIGLLFLL
ncbi:MAG TPA: transporter [Cytophagaceae bacterium]|jgi:outer membrane protein